MAQLKLYLLGSFKLVREDQLVTDFRSNKARALLAYLALAGREPITRQELYTLLWDGYSVEAALTSLRTTLSNLRKLLEPYAHLRTTHQTVQFVPGAGFWCDVDALAASLARPASDPDPELIPLLDLAQRSQFLRGFDQLDSPPFLQWREAQQARIQQQFEQLQSRQQLAQSQPVLSPVAPQAPWPHSLPRSLTPLIGRGEEIRTVVGKVLDAEYPLVVLVGEGGIGKTRLALAAAQAIQTRFAGQFPDGLWFVSLLGMTPGAEPADQLAEAIGQVLQLGQTSPEQLIAQLRPKRLVLILDNFESWQRCTDFLLMLLQGAPQVQLLITSRQRLAIQLEYPIRVTGLPTPPVALVDDDAGWQQATRAESNEADTAPPLDNLLRAIGRYASVQLFSERAQRIQPSFQLTAQNGRAVAQICQTVQGLPLALELAATLLRQSTSQQISATLAREYTALTADLPDLPAEHRSLHQVFEHSWQLLTSAQQRVFAQLAVFHGAFTREAVQAVTGNAAQLPDLLDRSLVTVVGEQRYELHSLLRQFAATRLATLGIVAASQRQHSHYYLTTGQSLLPYFVSPEPQRLWHWFQSEAENLTAAWQFAVEAVQLDLLAVGSQVVGLFYAQMARFAEGVRSFQAALAGVGQALAAQPTPAEQILLCQLRGELGMQLFYAGRAPEALDVLRLAVADLPAAPDPRVAALVYTHFGACCEMMRDPAARAALEQALVLAEQTNEIGLLLRVRSHLAMDFLQANDLDQALRLFNQNLALTRQLQLTEQEIRILTDMAYVETFRNNWQGTRQLLETILVLAEAHNMRHHQWVFYANLVITALMQSRFTAAQQMISVLANDPQFALQPEGPSTILHNRAELALQLGQYAQAAAWVEQAEVLLADRHSNWSFHLAEIYVTQSRLYYRWGDGRKSDEYAQRAWQFLEENHASTLRSVPLVRLGYGALAQQDYGEAVRVFTAAYAQQQALYPNELCLEAQIGAAYSWLLQGDLTKMQQHLADCATTLETQTVFDACEEPVEMFLFVYQMLQRTGATAQAQRVAAHGYLWLRQIASDLPDEASQQAFLTSNPRHRRLRLLAQG